jgi:ribonuclease P protein component
MLPKKNRLDLKKELFQIKRSGRLANGKLFSLLVKYTPEVFLRQKRGSSISEVKELSQPPPRFAFIISKKIHRRAVKRNQARRLLTEAVRVFLPKIKPGEGGVFLVKKAIIGKEFVEIKNEVEEIFKKANLFK